MKCLYCSYLTSVKPCDQSELLPRELTSGSWVFWCALCFEMMLAGLGDAADCLSPSIFLCPPPPPPHSAAFLRSWNCNRRIKWSANPLLCDFSELFIKSCYMPLYTCSSHKRHKTKQFVSSLSPSLYDAEYTQDKKCTKPKKNGTNWC